MGSPRQRRALAAAAAGWRAPPSPRSASAELLGRRGVAVWGSADAEQFSIFALLSTGCGGYARSCPWLPFRCAANAALGATRRVGVAVAARSLGGALLRGAARRRGVADCPLGGTGVAVGGSADAEQSLFSRFYPRAAAATRALARGYPSGTPLTRLWALRAGWASPWRRALWAARFCAPVIIILRLLLYRRGARASLQGRPFGLMNIKV